MPAIIFLLVLTAAVLVGSAARMYLFRRLYPTRYDYLVAKHADINDLEPALVYAVINVESRFDSTAVSHAGAKGLMQITPDTFDWLLTRIPRDRRPLPPHGADTPDIFEPETNIALGTFFLRMLYDEFGYWDTAFAAYNAGRGAVNGWLRDERYSHDGKTLHTIPFPETRNYVQRVNNAKEMYRTKVN